MKAISILDRIQVSHDHAFFASASNDGTVKLWESEKLEGNSVANRSKQTLKNTSLPGKILQKLCILSLYLPEITNICTQTSSVTHSQTRICSSIRRLAMGFWRCYTDFILFYLYHKYISKYDIWQIFTTVLFGLYRREGEGAGFLWSFGSFPFTGDIHRPGRHKHLQVSLSIL